MEAIRLLQIELDALAQESGLHISLNKSSVYAAGISDEKKRMIAAELGVQLGCLPVRYFGVPDAAQ